MSSSCAPVVNSSSSSANSRSRSPPRSRSPSFAAFPASHSSLALSDPELPEKVEKEERVEKEEIVEKTEKEKEREKRIERKKKRRSTLASSLNALKITKKKDRKEEKMIQPAREIEKNPEEKLQEVEVEVLGEGEGQVVEGEGERREETEREKVFENLRKSFVEDGGGVMLCVVPVNLGPHFIDLWFDGLYIFLF